MGITPDSKSEPTGEIDVGVAVPAEVGTDGAVGVTAVGVFVATGTAVEVGDSELVHAVAATSVRTNAMAKTRVSEIAALKPWLERLA